LLPNTLAGSGTRFVLMSEGRLFEGEIQLGKRPTTCSAIPTEQAGSQSIANAGSSAFCAPAHRPRRLCSISCSVKVGVRKVLEMGLGTQKSDPSAQVTAVTALSADTGASNADFITSQ